MRDKRRGPRRRDPGYATLNEIGSALAPFSRPPARTPYDSPASFVILELGGGDTRHGEIVFTAAARTTLMQHFRIDDARDEELLEPLAHALKLVFVEEHGYARRFTHRQLLVALRALARLNPSGPMPELPPAFLRAVMSSERRRRVGSLMPAGVAPRPQDLAHDPDSACAAWLGPLSATELASLADDLFQAVRHRRAGNFEELARRTQWDPLREGTIGVCARLWCEHLQRPPRAGKDAIAFAIDLLRLVDPTFSNEEGSASAFERVRKLLSRSMRHYQH